MRRWVIVASLKRGPIEFEPLDALGCAEADSQMWQDKKDERDPLHLQPGLANAHMLERERQKNGWWSA